MLQKLKGGFTVRSTTTYHSEATGDARWVWCELAHRHSSCMQHKDSAPLRANGACAVRQETGVCSQHSGHATPCSAYRKRLCVCVWQGMGDASSACSEREHLSDLCLSVERAGGEQLVQKPPPLLSPSVGVWLAPLPVPHPSFPHPHITAESCGGDDVCSHLTFNRMWLIFMVLVYHFLVK